MSFNDSLTLVLNWSLGPDKIIYLDHQEFLDKRSIYRIRSMIDRLPPVVDSLKGLGTILKVSRYRRT